METCAECRREAVGKCRVCRRSVCEEHALAAGKKVFGQTTRYMCPRCDGKRAEERDSAPTVGDPGRIVPIKIAGHWENGRVHVHRGDIFIDIPAELVRAVEADHSGRGERWGYQLLIERFRIADFFRDDLRRIDETRWHRDPAKRSE